VTRQPHSKVIRTLNVSPTGAVRASGAPRSYREGAAALFDLAAPPVKILPLKANETTRLGFERVGTSLREALGRARAR
jgi:hypothetical protein